MRNSASKQKEDGKNKENNKGNGDKNGYFRFIVNNLQLVSQSSTSVEELCIEPERRYWEKNEEDGKKNKNNEGKGDKKSYFRFTANNQQLISQSSTSLEELCIEAREDEEAAWEENEREGD